MSKSFDCYRSQKDWSNFRRCFRASEKLCSKKKRSNCLCYCWSTKKDKFCCFQSKYGEDLFQRLQINSPATLKRIIDKLTPLQLISIDIDVKGEAFEYFLKEAIKGQKKDLGQYFTPRHIVDFLVKLADPKPHETIYDPFCGTGGILIKVFNYIAERIPKNDAKK